MTDEMVNRSSATNMSVFTAVPAFNILAITVSGLRRRKSVQN